MTNAAAKTANARPEPVPDRLSAALEFANELNDSRLWKIKISYEKRWTHHRRQQKSQEIQMTRPWRLSTGPRTAAGRAASAYNALKSGGYRAELKELNRLLSALHWKTKMIAALLRLRLCRDASLLHKRRMTLEMAILKFKRALEREGIDNAWLDARLLVGGAAGVSGADMIARRDTPLSAEVIDRAEKFLSRRLEGEPVSRILGEREFFGRSFKITPDTLDPRPDTETLIDAALNNLKNAKGAKNAGEDDENLADLASWRLKPYRILDLGTGSGCILLTLLKELPNATGVGIDLNPGALAVSRENASQLGVDNRVDFRCGSWFEPLDRGESFDLIVSNPPYIPESDIDSLAREVKDHDPFLALSGGADGLVAYKSILKDIKKHLACGGFALLEIGAGQEKDLARLVEDSRMELTESYRDLAGHIRVLEIRMGKSGNIFDDPR